MLHVIIVFSNLASKNEPELMILALSLHKYGKDCQKQFSQIDHDANGGVETWKSRKISSARVQKLPVVSAHPPFRHGIGISDRNFCSA